MSSPLLFDPGFPETVHERLAELVVPETVDNTWLTEYEFQDDKPQVTLIMVGLPARGKSLIAGKSKSCSSISVLDC
jgi:hypothetical protein